MDCGEAGFDVALEAAQALVPGLGHDHVGGDVGLAEVGGRGVAELVQPKLRWAGCTQGVAAIGAALRTVELDAMLPTLQLQHSARLGHNGRVDFVPVASSR